MLGLITRFLIVINVVLVTACDSSTPNDVADDTIKNQSTEFLDTPQKDKQIVARIGMQAITLDKVDERIKLGLYDLDRQRYELRKAELKRIVEHELTQQSVSQSLTAELLLAPPLPPRLLVPFGERPVKGNVQAEVQLQIFCSYQSSHCARLQPVISQLDALYSIHLNIRYYDLPQSFHRNGHTSANAVRCASEQTMPWSFQNSIYSAVDQLNEDRYRIIAEQLGLDLREFSTCLTEQRYFDAINRDIKLGQSLGFGNVPVVLVNGLYLNGALPLEVYEYYINQELMRLGIELTSKEATLSSSRTSIRFLIRIKRLAFDCSKMPED